MFIHTSVPEKTWVHFSREKTGDAAARPSRPFSAKGRDARDVNMQYFTSS